MIYLPKDFAEDSMFPIKIGDSVFVKISFKNGEESPDWKMEKLESPSLYVILYSLL